MLCYAMLCYAMLCYASVVNGNDSATRTVKSPAAMLGTSASTFSASAALCVA